MRNWSQVVSWRATPAFSAPVASERRAGKPSGEGVRVASIALALLLCACAKVHVTPLSSTSDGRRQFEITCNRHATDDGTCNEKAVALCEGSYETQSVGRTGDGVSSYNGQIYRTPAARVLLIACNR
jgi:hypothetical protein